MSREQVMSALDKANAQKRAQMTVKTEVRLGQLKIREALDRACLARMPIWKLLVSMRGVGPKKVSEILEEISAVPRAEPIMLRPARAIGTLTPRERDAIAMACTRMGLPRA